MPRATLLARAEEQFGLNCRQPEPSSNAASSITEPYADKSCRATVPGSLKPSPEGLMARSNRYLGPTGQHRRWSFPHGNFEYLSAGASTTRTGVCLMVTVRGADRPYPSHWNRELILRDGTRVPVRPIRPDDESKILELLQNVSKEDLRLRFFDSIKEFTHEFVAKLTQLDYSRAMAFVALDETGDLILGVVRLHRDATYENGEFAILIRSNLKGRGLAGLCRGLGWALMQLMIEYARSEGIKIISGQIMHENSVMLDMCRDLRFEVK